MGIQLQLQGKITSWNDDKGYGFIAPLSGGKQLFVHIKSFKNRRQRPLVNQHVAYSASKDRQGRPCATDVSFIGKGSKKAELPSENFTGAAIFGGIGILSVGIAEFVINRSFLLAPFFLVMSVVAYLNYAADKRAAQKDQWRTPESHLHLLALIGGWPGAMIAQQKLRHKSRKAPFRFVFWITVVLNCGAVVWLLMPGQGLPILNSIVEALLNLPIIGTSVG